MIYNTNPCREVALDLFVECKLTTKERNSNMKIQNMPNTVKAVTEHNYMVGSFSEVTNEVSFSHNPEVHVTATDARKEAKRLALASPGKMFLMVQFIGAEFQPLATTVSL